MGYITQNSRLKVASICADKCNNGKFQITYVPKITHLYLTKYCCSNSPSQSLAISTHFSSAFLQPPSPSQDRLIVIRHLSNLHNSALNEVLIYRSTLSFILLPSYPKFNGFYALRKHSRSKSSHLGTFIRSQDRASFYSRGNHSRATAGHCHYQKRISRAFSTRIRNLHQHL